MELMNLTEEEVKACLEVVTKMREEKRRKETIQKNKEWLEGVIASIIDVIGLEETKRIVRDINRKLRSCSNELPFEEV